MERTVPVPARDRFERGQGEWLHIDIIMAQMNSIEVEEDMYMSSCRDLVIRMGSGINGACMMVHDD